MNPSETDRGQRWLSNFLITEQPAAKLLLDSLELVGQDQLRVGLVELIESLAAAIPTPIALVPIRELQSGQSYYPYDRNAKAPLLFRDSFPGSEAIVANIMSGLRRADENKGPFVAAPSLSNMRAAKCRSILLIDDFSGSGDRAVKFLDGFRNHSTLRSWSSYHLVDYHFCTYAMTQVALKRLGRVFGVGKIHPFKMCPTFGSRSWSSDEIDDVRLLCRKYQSARTYMHYLGHGEAGGLMALSHSAPNNLPVILWQRDRRGAEMWHPFFQGKVVPSDILPLFGMEYDDRQRISALRRLGQTRLTKTDWSKLTSSELKDVLLVLAAVARCPRNRHAVAELTGLPLSTVRMSLNACQAFELIDRTLHLTDRGRLELRHARNVKLPADEFSLSGSALPYYPKSLRVGC